MIAALILTIGLQSSPAELGIVQPAVVVTLTAAADKCLSLPENPHYGIVGPHGGALIDRRCRVIERPGPGKPWTTARYEWTSVFTAEDPSRGKDARDTVTEEEAVVFQATASGSLRAVWHERFETGGFAILRSITAEVAPRKDGTTLLSIMRCVNGTGGCDQQFLYRGANGDWSEVKQTWFDELPTGYSGRLRKGVRIDPVTLAGTAPFYGDADANCCASQEMIVDLALRAGALVLQKPPILRRIQI